MSSSHIRINHSQTVIQKMLAVASTAPFEAVRSHFFYDYIHNIGYHNIISEKEFWLETASSLVDRLKNVCPGYAKELKKNKNQISNDIAALLQKPGTPYQRVGYVLEWFKEWRGEMRKKSKNIKRFDTQHAGLQSLMKGLLNNVCAGMISSDPNGIGDELGLLWQYSNKGLVSTDINRLVEPHTHLNYNVKKSTALTPGALTDRELFFQQSAEFRAQLEHASPWSIMLDWCAKSRITHSESSCVTSRHVPAIYTLSRYLLEANEKTWNRAYVCNALREEKTYAPYVGIPSYQTGIELGLARCENIDNDKYQRWWSEQEQASSKDWRHIRRQSALNCEKITNLSDGNLDVVLTLGDAVARLKKKGPMEVVNGVFRNLDRDTKSLLLNRIQPDLGEHYLSLLTIEDTLGPMPDMVIEKMDQHLRSNQETAAQPIDFFDFS